MTSTKVLAACGVALVLSLAAPVELQAQTWRRTTYLTFNQPVMLPGVTLPAGTYLFELVDSSSAAHVVRVTSADRSHHYAMFMTIPRYRTQTSEHNVVAFGETPEGIAPAIKAWFYPGDTYGYEFIYPTYQARYIARATEQVVVAADVEPGEKDAAKMRGLALSSVAPSGKETALATSARPGTVSAGTTTDVTVGQGDSAPSKQ
jgi:hypothetical protein